MRGGNLQHLPDSLLLEILRYLSTIDGIEFTKINVANCTSLIKQVRKVEVKANIISLFQCLAFQEILSTVISNPNKQLLINGSIEIPHLPGDVNPFSISCLQLETSPSLLLSYARFTGKLTRLYLRISRYPIERVDFSSIIHFINSKADSLKELSFQNIDFTDLPLDNVQIEKLEIRTNYGISIKGLHLSRYNNLRSLKLEYCHQITDVRCLDSIHELSLIGCEGIYNITCLNNNYKILIHDCYNIEDYSHSFRNSRFIEIRISRDIFRNGEQQQFLSFNPSNLLHVASLKVIYTSLYLVNDNLFFISSLQGLRVLHIVKVKEAFSLPKNQIRDLIIDTCPSFIMTETVKTIYKVTLNKLDIISLECLGEGNKVVEISNCHKIIDFSPLRACRVISIVRCKEFIDARSLKGVKELRVTPHDHTEPFISLEGVTHLCLDLFVELMELITNISAINNLNTVKELCLIPAFFTQAKEFYELLLRNPQIQKVVIKHGIYNKSDGYRWVQLLKEYLSESFTIDHAPMSCLLVVLRR